MHKEIGKLINDLADSRGTELTPQELFAAFEEEYLKRTSPISLHHFKSTGTDSTKTADVSLSINSHKHDLIGTGNGPVDAFVNALGSTNLPKFDVVNYSEHSLGTGAEARAVSYIQIRSGARTLFGAGIDTNIELASIKAIVCALNRLLASR